MAAPGYSIRARLLLGAALVLVAFLVGAGLAVQRAHADSVRAAHFARLQITIYLLLARAELEADGTLVMPAELAEPRLSLPSSGLYAGIVSPLTGQAWRSASTVGLAPPLRGEGVDPGQWRQETIETAQRSYHVVSYGVNWTAASRATPLVLSVAEDRATFDRELAVFARTLWAWLGGAGVLLLGAQILLLQWGLKPLSHVAREIRRIEGGEQARIEGRYPTEISGLTEGLNTLIQQERSRQGRYQEALSFLAHSLKTPLAVLRNALHEPAQLPAAVREQVARLDDIVQHQLGRARASGATKFAPPVLLVPVLDRVRDALAKVHAGKGLAIAIACEPALSWRIEEGDLFEILGNTMDNAAKWARARVAVRAWREAGKLHLQVDDDGPGFADPEAAIRIHVRHDERVPGHGVGLAIVADLVASHHGELAIARGELGGARLRIVLPPP